MGELRKNNNPPPGADHGMAAVVSRNIAALLERRQTEELAKGFQERVADAVTAFTGSMPFVYIHLVLVRCLDSDQSLLAPLPDAV